MHWEGSVSIVEPLSPLSLPSFIPSSFFFPSACHGAHTPGNRRRGGDSLEFLSPTRPIHPVSPPNAQVGYTGADGRRMCCHLSPFLALDLMKPRLLPPSTHTQRERRLHFLYFLDWKLFLVHGWTEPRCQTFFNGLTFLIGAHTIALADFLVVFFFRSDARIDRYDNVANISGPLRAPISFSSHNQLSSLKMELRAHMSTKHPLKMIFFFFFLKNFFLWLSIFRNRFDGTAEIYLKKKESHIFP